MPRYIVIKMLDHTSDSDAEDFAREINTVFQPHHDARIITVSDEVAAKIDFQGVVK